MAEKKEKTTARTTHTSGRAKEKPILASDLDPDEEEERREKLIKAELKRLNDIFKDVDGKKKRIAKASIDDCAFLAVSMADLRKQINREGTEVEYQNGANQWGKKQSPSVLNYLQMSQKLTAAMKVLLDCIPKTTETKRESTTDGFDDFVIERGDD